MSALTAMMPPVKYAKVNGIRMAYYEAGPEGEGVPLVFCHGFPEIAFPGATRSRPCPRPAAG